MLPALAGFAAKALMPSKKKINKDKLLNRKESSAIQKVEGGREVVKTPTIKRKKISTDLFLPQPEIKALPPASEVSKDVKSGKLNNIFDKVAKTLKGIIDVLRNKDKIQKEDEKIKRKNINLDKKSEREEKLEKKARKKPLKFNVKMPGDKFNLMRFFGNILLGSIALAIFKNLEKIIETLKNVFQTIKDFVDKLGEFFSPIWNGLKWIVGKGTELVGKLLGVPSENLDDKDILKNLNEIKNKIPFLENLFKGIENTINSIRGGGSEPSATGGVVDAGGGAVPLAGGAKAGAYDIAAGIGANKQQWDIFRNTVAQIESGGSYTKYGGSGNHYDGRYQMGAAAKKDAARILGIPYPGHSDDPNDPRRIAFRSNPELQERMFAAYTLANHGYLSSDPNYQAKQTVEQKLQVLGYAHNQGAGGASKWMRTGKVGRDGFGTAGTKYTNALRQAFKSSSTYTQDQANVMPTPSTQSSQPSTIPSSISPASTSAPSTNIPSQDVSSPQISPANASFSETTIAQVSQVQSPSSASMSVPQIMQQAEYEIPYQASKSTILPIPIGGDNAQQIPNVSGRSSISIGLSKKEALNSYYQAQLIGFLYKQG